MKSSILIVTSIASSTAFQPIHRTNSNGVHTKRRRLFNFSTLQMKPSIIDADITPERRPRTSLSAATLESSSVDESLFPNWNVNVAETVGSAGKVLSASLLVTGNTVGSSMFVLPDAVGSVGMAWGSVIFIGIYMYNLLSGLMLANVAINLHETSDCEVPSSFKDFADCAMQDTTAGNLIGAASLLMNSCFLSYGMVQVGSFVTTSLLPGMNLDATAMAAVYSIVLGVAFSTQKSDGIEKIANVAVMVLFSSFLTLLLPSLAHVPHPMDTFLAHSGTPPSPNDGGFSAAMAASIPLILSTMIYQNIVPSVTKLLGFDRTKSTVAIALGSFFPMLMYMAWSFAVLGGGLDNSLSSGAGGAMFAAFTASSFIGSSIGCVMSLAEEYESILTSITRSDQEKMMEGTCTIDGGFSTPAVIMSVLPPAAVALAVSSGGDGAFTAPLHLSGAIIAPFLYGILPVMLFKSMQSDDISSKDDDFSKMSMMPQLMLGVSTLGLLGNEVVHDCANWFS